MLLKNIVVIWLSILFVSACAQPNTSATKPASLSDTSFMVTKSNSSGGKRISTGEALDYLRRRAADDPDFLDKNRRPGARNVDAITFRRLLEQLEAYEAGKDMRAQYVVPDTVLMGVPVKRDPWIVDQFTLVDDGAVDEYFLVATSMNLSYHGAGPIVVKETVTIQRGISQIVFGNQKDSSSIFPWISVMLVKFSEPGDVMTTTVHHVSTPNGDANASTSALAKISASR